MEQQKEAAFVGILIINLVFKTFVENFLNFIHPNCALYYANIAENEN